jgi:TolB-like protein
MVYRFEDFELDLDCVELRRAGKPVPMEPQVFALLALLVENAERMVSKEEIHDRIWSGRVVSDAALNSRIRSARQAVGDDGKSQRLIRTVRTSGFRFVGTVSSSGPAAPSATAPAAVAAAGMSRPCIAVLPFENQSEDPAQDFFADAVAADILAALSKHRWIEVLSRSATFGFKGRPVDIRQLARDLNATYVVEGTVRRSGDRIRVSVQLTDAATGASKWGERYDRDVEDVFAVQDDVTETIVARLEPEIGFAERRKVARSVPRDLHAWEAFHLGLAEFFKFTAAGNEEAQRLLQRSREMDPGFGEAHAWWAYAVILGMVYWDTEPEPGLLDRALAATHRALEIDDQNAVFHALKARVQLARCEYAEAIAANEAAIALNPTLATAYCGLADSLAYEGRYDEALQRFERALQLSTNDPQRWAFLSYGALALIFKGDFEAAVRWADRACAIPNCQYWTTAHKAVALAHLGRLGEARRAAGKLLKQKPGFSLAFAKRKLFYLKRPEQLRIYLDGLAKAGVPRR